MMWWALSLLPLAAATAASSPRLAPETPIVASAADRALPAFELALRDLRRDFYSVLGSPPVVLGAPPPLLRNVAAEGVVAAIFVGTKAGAPWLISAAASACWASSEAHCVREGPDDVLVAAGGDGLGAVYALYALSEAVLGVVPLHFFADLPPQPHYAGVLLPPTLPLHFAPRGFRTRCVFINDEDLSAGFGADPLGDGIGAELYSAIFEAVLRLKGNAVISGTANFPDQRGGTTLASRRGLQLLQHHVTPLGLNVMRWPNADTQSGVGRPGWKPRSAGGPPFSFHSSPEVLQHGWTVSAKALLKALDPAAAAAHQRCNNASSSVIWTVGLRGLNDYAWWLDSQGDPAVADSALRGKVIGDAMVAQLKILRDIQPAGPLQAVAYMWSEMLSLWSDGHLTLPPGVTTIFADDGGGHIQGLEKVAPGDGLYYHVSCRANQLTEQVGVSTIVSEIGRFLQNASHLGADMESDGEPAAKGQPKRASVFILNLSDLRPYLLSASAAMAMAWNPDSLAPAAASSSIFVQHWASLYFGLSNAVAVAGVYAEFAAVLAAGGRSLGSDFGVANQIENLVFDMLKVLDDGGGNFSSLVPRATALYEPALAQSARWLHLSQESARVGGRLNARVRPAFVQHALAQQLFLGNATSSLAHLAGSILPQNRTARIASVAAAVASADGCLASLRLAEGVGRWRGLFAHDRLDDFQHARRRLLQLHVALGEAEDAFPYVRDRCSCTGMMMTCAGTVSYAQCPDLFANQLAPNYDPAAYPLLKRAADAALSFDGVVTGGCRGDCETTPVGGRLLRNATSAFAWLGVPRAAGVFVCFTVDGSPVGRGVRVLLKGGEVEPCKSPAKLWSNDSQIDLLKAPRAGLVVTVKAQAFGGREDTATPVSVFQYYHLPSV